MRLPITMILKREGAMEHELDRSFLIIQQLSGKIMFS